MTHNESVAIWHIYYLHMKKTKYVYDGKQMSALKKLVAKIRIKILEYGMEDNSENLSNSFKSFLSSINDRFTIENLEISLVNSHFNKLYSHAIRNSPLGIKNAVDSLIEQGLANRKAAEQ